MIQITAPGLPPYPPLMFDSERRQAVVSVKHPTWQSHGWAIYTTHLMVWLTTALFAYQLFGLVQAFDSVLQFILWLFLTLFFYSGTHYSFHRSLRYFLAHRIFATKTSLWFSAEAVTFKSRLYAKSVVVWRSWMALPVMLKFILQPDLDLQQIVRNYRTNLKVPSEHLFESAMLEIVITSIDRQRNIDQNTQGMILRSIPVTEISSRLATKFTMVCAAALMLTAANPEMVAKKSEQGIDLDKI